LLQKEADIPVAAFMPTGMAQDQLFARLVISNFGIFTY
jgi:hypothetical protein